MIKDVVVHNGFWESPVVRRNLVRTVRAARSGENSRIVPAIILCLFRFLRLLFSGQQALVIENLALRRQLAAYKRRCKRPLLNEWDRLFWIGLSRVWTGWRGALVFVQPDTVVRWQRDRFRRFWARLSRVDGRRAGRPALAPEVRRLILQMARVALAQ